MNTQVLTCAFVLGTRPEAIKLAPIFLAMQAQPRISRPILWVTGQHQELIDQVFNVFGMKPDADFALMRPNQSQSTLSAPTVNALVYKILGQHRRIALLPPLTYPELAKVLVKSWLVLTGSSELQEEAPSLHKPVLVLRDVTERPEGMETGVAELVGTNPQELINSVRRLAVEPNRYQRMVAAKSPYGDGFAASVILH